MVVGELLEGPPDLLQRGLLTGDAEGDMPQPRDVHGLSALRLGALLGQVPVARRHAGQGALLTRRARGRRTRGA